MSERLALKGKLTELRKKKMSLATKADANIKAGKNLLSMSSVTPLEDIDLQAALVLLGDAKKYQDEYHDICEQIKTIEKELED